MVELRPTFSADAVSFASQRRERSSPRTRSRAPSPWKRLQGFVPKEATSMTHSFREHRFPLKPLRPRGSPHKGRSARSIRSPRRLPEHLSSVLLLRRLLILLVASILPLGAIALLHRHELDLTGAVLYRSPRCTCCDGYARYLSENGFDVTIVSVIDLIQFNRQHGMPEAMDACHTMLVGGYLVEGDVPADIIKRLLAERPDIIGVSLPGIHADSPDLDRPRKGRTTVYSIGKNEQSVFATVQHENQTPSEY